MDPWPFQFGVANMKNDRQVHMMTILLYRYIVLGVPILFLLSCHDIPLMREVWSMIGDLQVRRSFLAIDFRGCTVHT